MKNPWVGRIVGVAFVLLIVGALYLALRPSPVQVDMAAVDRGYLSVTVDEEGLARIADVYTVSAPIGGRLQRAPVEVGDVVHRGTTSLATIMPADPPFLDVRMRREIEAAVEAAEAAVGLAQAQIRAAKANALMLRSEFERAEQLAARGTISGSQLDRAATALSTAEAEVEQSEANLEFRQSELLRAEASLIEPDQAEVNPSRDACCLTVRAPVDGVVLKVASRSEQVVQAGAQLVEIGDPDNMEVIVHLLSSDAVKVRVGAAATLTDWGGEGELDARVISIDPAAYTKVSALGIEEQRVDAVLELLGGPEAWAGLGHDFRVMVHITLWQDENGLRVPVGALFRRGGEWHVFRDVDGTAALTPVEIGRRNNDFAEVIDGLDEGDRVVLHPSDRVADGVEVAEREDGAA